MSHFVSANILKFVLGFTFFLPALSFAGNSNSPIPTVDQGVSLWQECFETPSKMKYWKKTAGQIEIN